MGLLDEAIREHLDLKRRRGADPGEVERLEREALGPVRRGAQEQRDVATQEPGVAASVAYSEEEAPYPEDEGTEWVETASDELVFDHESERESEPEAPRHHEIAEEWDAHDPLDLQEPPGPVGADQRRDEEPLAAEPRPDAAGPPSGDAPPPAPAQADHPGEETVEYDVEVEELAEGEEDVLEETPEFLQDTPDHDRLWFEQRPPRDFDFDS